MNPLAHDETTLPDPATPAPDARPAVAMLHALRGNLGTGARLALLRPTTLERFTITPGQLIALTALSLLLAFAMDLAEGGLPGYFNVWGLPGAMFPLPLMLLAGFMVSRAAPVSALAIPIALLSAMPYVSLLTLALYPLGRALDLSNDGIYYAYYWAPFAWWLLITIATARMIAGGAWRTTAVAWAAIGLLVIAPGVALPRTSIGTLWMPTDDELTQTRGARSSLASEEAFYAQPELLRRALNGLLPGNGSSAHLYFVGVAGDAEDDVFRKELASISSLMQQRFGTGGRTITLVNSAATALDTPLASRTSLTRTLARVGQVMNRDEDVLFLYLTSHGSQDHRFALNFWPLRLTDLDPQSLRQMLDAARIRWRIVVVSACYSGGFIRDLKSDTTLVITAADADHTSFGCGSDSDFTYFGKAYFDQALRRHVSFTNAFEEARKTIAAREKSEDKTPSNPQIFVGRAMREKLQQLEAQLRRQVQAAAR
jgi:hypothetical protein